MAPAVLKVVIALAMLGGVHAGAAAASVTPISVRVTTIRNEPTRTGGMPCEPRETTPFWQSDAGAALPAKPVLKRKNRRH
jgi:hypothetical protein